jgi:hypothetical protein
MRTRFGLALVHNIAEKFKISIQTMLYLSLPSELGPDLGDGLIVGAQVAAVQGHGHGDGGEALRAAEDGEQGVRAHFVHLQAGLYCSTVQYSLEIPCLSAG